MRLRPDGFVLRRDLASDFNTRAVARTPDGKLVWWDYSRALLPGPALEPGRVIHLLLDSTGAAAGMALGCPANLSASGAR